MSDLLAPHEYIIKRLKEIRPSESIIYFTGFLEEVRTNEPHGPTNAVATLAYSLMERGIVHLTQRRMSEPVTHVKFVDWHHGMGKGFIYIATGALPKRSKWND